MTELTRQILALDETVSKQLEAAAAETQRLRRDADESAEALMAEQKLRFEAFQAAERNRLEKQAAQEVTALQASLEARKEAYRRSLDIEKTVQALLSAERDRVCR